MEIEAAVALAVEPGVGEAEVLEMLQWLAPDPSEEEIDLFCQLLEEQVEAMLAEQRGD